MGIRFTCSHCGHELNVKSHLAGRRAFCPKCEGRLTIPDNSSMSQAGSKVDDIASLDKSTEVGESIPISSNASSSNIPQLGPLTKQEIVPVAKVLEGGQKEVEFFSLDQPGDKVSTQNASTLDPFEEAPDAVWYVRPPAGGQFGPASKELIKKWLSEGRVSHDSHVWREGWPDWKSASETFVQTFGATKSEAIDTAKSSGLSKSLASQKLYIKRKRRRNTLGIVVILLGILIIVALTIVLVIVLQSN